MSALGGLLLLALFFGAQYLFAYGAYALAAGAPPLAWPLAASAGAIFAFNFIVRLIQDKP